MRPARGLAGAYWEIDRSPGRSPAGLEDLFDGLTQEQREASKQLFLQLASPGEGLVDARRLVPRAELMLLDVDRSAMEQVSDGFGGHPLLAFDRA